MSGGCENGSYFGKQRVEERTGVYIDVRFWVAEKRGIF
jgi:hypothetical protein